jgi:predicted metal-binding membrane protein
MTETAKQSLLRPDRLAIVASLLGIVVISWLYLWLEALSMDSMVMEAGAMGPTHIPSMPVPSPWSIGSLLPTFLMWAIMMCGMMIPSAAPAILLYASIVRKNRERGSILPSAWIFTTGYLAVWTGFSLAAALLHAALDYSALLTPMMVSSSTWLNGGLLILAGVYQWLPIKEVCLEKCRAPLQFFLFRWRPGVVGAFRMGAEHGTFCVGCCWAIMLLLFAVGVMNLLWVALIAGLVLAEKLLPGGKIAGRLIGVALAVGGVAMIVGP